MKLIVFIIIKRKNSDSGIQKKPLTNIFGGFRNAPKNSHKYALLEDQEDIELIKSRKD